jgi:hypothetical protein
MKYLMLFSLLLSLPAMANNEKLSCKSSDGQIEFTRDWLVIKSTDRQGLFEDIEAFTSQDAAAEPQVGDILEFKPRYDSEPILKLAVQKAGKWKKVAGEENSCGVGFESNRFPLQVELTNGEIKKVVKLECTHYLGYHGHNCRK